MEEKKPVSDKTVYTILGVILIVFVILYFGTRNNSQNSQTNFNTPSNSSYLKNTTEKTPQISKKEVTVIDFSTMTQDDIKAWFTTNKIDGRITNEYSDTIQKGNFVSQSIPANSTIYEGDKLTVIYSLGKEPTLGEKNALKKANSYLSHSSFSYKRLIEQLKYEGFSQEESVYAVDNCGADWSEQAAKKAASYMSHSSFSKTRLKEQLLYEGFTAEQADYGVKSVGY